MGAHPDTTASVGRPLHASLGFASPPRCQGTGPADMCLLLAHRHHGENSAITYLRNPALPLIKSLLVCGGYSMFWA
jgi:hypothetical protein